MKQPCHKANYLPLLQNKAAKGKKGALVAMIKGTQSEKVISILEKISLTKRKQVQESKSRYGCNNEIIKHSFPKAVLVIDRFHV